MKTELLLVVGICSDFQDFSVGNISKNNLLFQQSNHLYMGPFILDWICNKRHYRLRMGGFKGFFYLNHNTKDPLELKNGMF